MKGKVKGCIIIDLNLSLQSHTCPVRALFLDRVDRAGGSSLWTLLSSSSPLARGLLFLPIGLDVTLMVIFGTELDVPNIRVLLVTMESM